MAEYNQWMNRKLYGFASELDEVQLKADKGAFFKSVFGTLNHIMVADILWLLRFARHPSGFKSLDYIRSLDKPDNLDTVLHDSLEELQEERNKLDSVMIEFTNEISDDELESVLDYQNFKGEPFQDKMGQLLLHLFNHQTHHRGQLTTLFSQMGIDVGATDLPVMWRSRH